MLAETCTYDAIQKRCNAGDSLCSTGSRSDDILVASHHQSHRVPYLLPISLCILPRFGSSTWIHRSYIHGDSGLEADLLHTVQEVEVRQHPRHHQARLLPKLSCSQSRAFHCCSDCNICMRVRKCLVVCQCLGIGLGQKICWRSCWPVFVALRSFSTWSFQCVVVCQCLGIAHGSNLLVFLLASALYHCVPSQNLSRRAPRFCSECGG